MYSNVVNNNNPRLEVAELCFGPGDNESIITIPIVAWAIQNTGKAKPVTCFGVTEDTWAILDTYNGEWWSSEEESGNTEEDLIAYLSKAREQ